MPLWGGIGEQGFAPVTFHSHKKLSMAEWVRLVESGKLRAVMTKCSGRRRRPWVVLCDNEKFLKGAAVKDSHTAVGVSLWHIPPGSPDLNPIERFWSWLRRRLLALDLQDATAGRPTLSKAAYRERVRAVCQSRRAQAVAIACHRGLRRVCQRVVNARGDAVHA